MCHVWRSITGSKSQRRGDSTVVMAGSAVAGAARVLTARLQAQVSVESGALADTESEARVVEAVAQVVVLPTTDDRVVPIVAMGDATVPAPDAAARRGELDRAMGRVRARRHIGGESQTDAATWRPTFVSHSTARSRSRARMHAKVAAVAVQVKSQAAVPTARQRREGGARASGSEGPRGGRCGTSRGATEARGGAHGCARGRASASVAGDGGSCRPAGGSPPRRTHGGPALAIAQGDGAASGGAQAARAAVVPGRCDATAVGKKRPVAEACDERDSSRARYIL